MLKKLEKLRLFLRGLQRSDRSRKKRWLVGLTAAVMIFVVALWFVYVNAVGLPVLAEQPTAAVAREEGRSTWEIFKTGLNEIFSEASSQFETSKKLIGEQFQKTNEVVVDATSTATSTATSSPPSQ